MCDAPIPKFCEEVDPERQPSTPTMATLLPPPKRQKLYHGVPEPEPELPKASPNVVVQFVSEDDGAQLAPAVSLPANVSRDDLQSLVNSLSKNVRATVPALVELHRLTRRRL